MIESILHYLFEIVFVLILDGLQHVSVNLAELGKDVFSQSLPRQGWTHKVPLLEVFKLVKRLQPIDFIGEYFFEILEHATIYTNQF